METQKKIIVYRLPEFAKLSKTISVFGLVFLLASIFIAFFKDVAIFNESAITDQFFPFLFAILERMITTMPVIFVVLSFVLVILGNGGLEFSTEKYFETIKEEGVSITFEINLTIFLAFIPLITSPFDKNIVMGNVMYVVSAGLYYVVVLGYTALLLWHKNAIRKIITS